MNKPNHFDPGAQDKDKLDSDHRIKTIIYRFLTRREYSRLELERKLIKKEFNSAQITPLLDHFAQEDLQSDQRFAEAFCRFRASKGYGPFKIEVELRLKGISDEIIAQTLDSIGRDWYKTAKEIIDRRFGVDKISSLEDRGKRWRFLQNRGFTSDQIKTAIELS